MKKASAFALCSVVIIGVSVASCTKKKEIEVTTTQDTMPAMPDTLIVDTTQIIDTTVIMDTTHTGHP